MMRRLRNRATFVLALLGAASGTACREAPGHAIQQVPGGDPARGRTLIAMYGCGSCHHVPGVPGAVGRVGPSFDGFAQRTYLAGSVRNMPAELIRWIRTPQLVRPGTVMPDLGVGEREAGDIAAFLYTLEPGGLGPPHLLPATLLPGH